MKKLLITRPVPDVNIAFAREHFDATIRPSAIPLTREEAIAALAEYDAIVPTLGDDFSAATFDAAGEFRCGVLSNVGVGYNHIDVTAARAKGVQVTNTPGVVTDATADIGMSLILAACRRASEGERILRAGRWQGFGPMDMLGTHVTGKTLGIVGMGRIGQAVAHRGHYGFSMPVIYFNRSKKEVDVPSRQVETLHELMGEADIVVVTVPVTAETKNIIDADALAAMKPSGVFINIARGNVVDEPALIDVLERGAIRAAGLDVYVNEPEVPERLRVLENAVLYPHLGTAALEVREMMGQMALDNVLAWSEGKTLPQGLES
ncbi:2-hydroxyacid dehydrogenase [Pseudoroseicyclus tamaricis]|uniref:D-glycerate dehydrogenase n=1 Tax=Pseudoroseicyclus tamaricis TaxID=2705421 RepID=A0A6B2JUW9_9RHOB|nr:D-glycerate dehydrogenase [Pseudoroseicyclus tamaricis]NDU99973.1 D-glycerate dehydrogenase [Pseudoroseicyclus tamaricis]